MVRMNKMVACGMLLASLAGCNVLGALSSGKGTVKAEATLPPKARVLVFVDPRPQTQMTPESEALLAEAIMNHLWKYKAADNFVPQQQVVLARARHAEANDFAAAAGKVGTADVARETGADVVIHVDVVDYMMPQLSESQITIGYATVLVKVMDKNGNPITSGPIAWQAEQAEVYYRNLRIQVLQ